jgi:redox-sensitive bicupin YhaK (pirin superfamily)
MAIEIRRDRDIYAIDGGWFQARWHFSFDRYRDPEQMGFGNMRVFNDDRLVPGAIWPLHPHRDIEGLTYVVEGRFRHEDNVGGPPGPLPAGSVQRMTLGSGAWHSEQNASQDEPMRFIQIWIMPRELDLPPGVEQRVFTTEDRTDRPLRAIAPEGGDAVLVHANASVYLSRLTRGTEVKHDVPDGMGEYLYVISGDLALGDQRLGTGDAAKIAGEPSVGLRAEQETELIMVEVDLGWNRR